VLVLAAAARGAAFSAGGMRVKYKTSP
jgi:hypothetical protein